jgi:hypothetical protein
MQQWRILLVVMQVIQKTKITIITIALAFGLVLTTLFISTSVGASECGGVQTSIINCSQTGDGGGVENSGLWGLLLLAINILTAGIGIAAVAGIVYGSVLYTSAADNPEQVKKAIEIIRNVVIGLVAYALMYSALNFLIPGGLFT